MARKSVSPTAVVKPQVTMTFLEAMKLVMDGKKVTKLEWDNPEIVVYLDRTLRIVIDGKVHDLIVSDGDMFGTDWVEV